MSNPDDYSEFNWNNEKSYRHPCVEPWDQERQGMADPTESCYGTADQPGGGYVSSNSRMRLSKRRLGAKPRFANG